MKKILTIAAILAAAALSSCTTTHTLTVVKYVDEDGFVTGIYKDGQYTPVVPIPDQQTGPTTNYVGIPSKTNYVYYIK